MDSTQRTCIVYTRLSGCRYHTAIVTEAIVVHESNGIEHKNYSQEASIC
jgi:hypothetical protein